MKARCGVSSASECLLMPIDCLKLYVEGFRCSCLVRYEASWHKNPAKHEGAAFNEEQALDMMVLRYTALKCCWTGKLAKSVTDTPEICF